MARRIRFFAEFCAEFPLWTDDDRDAGELLRDEALPDDLIERLRRWNEEFNEQPHGEPPHSQGPLGEWLVDFHARGRALADEVAAHLGPDYAVQYEP